MNREIKFRGKRVDNGEWVYGGYVKEHRDNSHLIFVNEFGAINAGFKPRREDFVLSYYEVGPETIGQYTGLKDKNGVDIYEGDIVLYKHASYKDISRILYHEEVGSFVMEAIKEDDNTSMAKFRKGTIRGFVAGRVNGYDYVKVIGNIYENKDLLKEEGEDER